MLRLWSTEEAKAALVGLKASNPQLFTKVRDRINDLRAEPDGKAKGRTFRLDDGRTAHLATFYDATAPTHLVLVWRIADGADGGELHVIAVEHAPAAEDESLTRSHS